MADYNTFERITVDGYAFSTDPNVIFDYRHSNLSFSMVWEGTGVIQYSFNGSTVHGDMTSGAATAAMFFDDRPIGKIWFRISTGVGGTVRVEGWAK
jgi:hypothetical protein